MNRFRELRLQNGYTQKQLRDLYNAKYGRSYSAGALSLIESGKRMPELSALLDFADFYGVSLDYLLGRDLDSKTNVRVTKEYRKGRRWHLSEYLRELAAGLALRTNSERAADSQPDVDDKDKGGLEYRQNINMLKCLLQQSVILAERVEKNGNSWYRF